LFGHCNEIDVNATVLYTVQPEITNKYFPGFGVGFDDINEQQKEQLQRYIREHFLREVSSSRDGIGDFTEKQLKN
jgi:hypothetical protein